MRGFETITVVRSERGDRLDPTPTAEQRFDIKSCIIWPRAAHEEDRGWVQVSGFNVFVPPGSDIDADDQVECRGELYSVEGVPGDYRKKGKPIGLLVTLGRAV